MNTKRLLTSLMVIAFMSVILGQGVVSFMADTETAAGNTFTAGTIDLQVDGTDHPPALIQLPDLKPCQESMDVEIPYSNVGTNAGVVTLSVSYVEGDDEAMDQDPGFEYSAASNPAYEVSADDFAKQVFITKAVADTGTDQVNLMPTLVLYAEGVYPAVGGNPDGRVSIFEFAWQEDPANPGTNIPRVWPLTEVLFPGQSESLIMRFHLDGMVGNEYQADGISAALTFDMMQWVPDKSMVLDLQFDEGSGTVANDSSIYGNNGAITGATWVSDPPYKNYALEFDGSGDRVIVPNSPSLQFNQGLTLETWVKTDTIAAGVTRIVDRVGAVGAQHWTLYRSGNKLVFQVLTNAWAMVTSPAMLVTDTWYHVAATYDGAFARLFVDGVEIASAPISGPIGVGQTYLPIAVGAWVRNNGDVFDGIIDRARIYDRALEPSEVFFSYLTSYSHYHGAP